MSRVLLDTSAYSAFMLGHPSAIETIQWAEEICVNPIALGELKAGFLRGSRRDKNDQELKQFLAS